MHEQSKFQRQFSGIFEKDKLEYLTPTHKLELWTEGYETTSNIPTKSKFLHFKKGSKNNILSLDAISTWYCVVILFAVKRQTSVEVHSSTQSADSITNQYLLRMSKKNKRGW